MQSNQERTPQIYANGHAEDTANRGADPNLGTVHQDANVQPVMTIALQELNTLYVDGIDMEENPNFHPILQRFYDLDNNNPVHTTTISRNTPNSVTTLANYHPKLDSDSPFIIDHHGFDNNHPTFLGLSTRNPITILDYDLQSEYPTDDYIAEMEHYDWFSDLRHNMIEPLATIIDLRAQFFRSPHNCVDFTQILSHFYNDDKPFLNPFYRDYGLHTAIAKFFHSSCQFHYELVHKARAYYPDTFSYFFFNENGESPILALTMDAGVDDPNTFITCYLGGHRVEVHSIHDILKFQPFYAKHEAMDLSLDFIVMSRFAIYMYLVEARDILRNIIGSDVVTQYAMTFSVLHRYFSHPALIEIKSIRPYAHMLPYYRFTNRNNAQCRLFKAMERHNMGHYDFYHLQPDLTTAYVLTRAHYNSLVQDDIIMENYVLYSSRLPYLDELIQLYPPNMICTPLASEEDFGSLLTPDHFVDIAGPALSPSCCGTFKLFLKSRTKVEYHKTLLIKALEAANIRFQPIVCHFIMNCEALFLFLEHLRACTTMRHLYSAVHSFHNAVSLSKKVRIVYKEIAAYLLAIPLKTGKASGDGIGNPFTHMREWLEDPTSIPDALGRHFFVLVSYLCGMTLAKEKMPSLANYGSMVTRNMPEAYRVNEVKFLGAILFILEGGWQMCIHKDMTWVHSKHSYSRLARRIVQAGKDVKLLQEMREGNHEKYATVALFEDEIRDINAKLDEIYVIQGGTDTNTLKSNSSIHQYRVLSLRIDKVSHQIRRFKITKYMRMQPFTTYFYGKAGVGKSICRDATMHLTQWTFKRARRPAYNLSLDDIRPDGYDGEEDVSADDLDQIANEFGGDAVMRVLQRLDNTNPFRPDFSDLPKKGQISMEPKNIWLTSNNCPPVNQTVYPHKKALYRRMQYVMEVKLRDGKKDLKYNAVKPFTYSPEQISSTYMVTLRHWNEAHHDESNMSTLDTWVPVPGLVDVTLQEAQAGLMAIMKVHFARQESALRVSEALASDVGCEHGTMKGICHICTPLLACVDGECNECAMCKGGHNDEVMKLTVDTILQETPELAKADILGPEEEEVAQPRAFIPLTVGALTTMMIYNSSKFHTGYSRVPLIYGSSWERDLLIQRALTRYPIMRFFTRKKDRGLEFAPHMYGDEAELEFNEIRHPLGLVDRVNLHKLVQIITVLATVYVTYAIGNKLVKTVKAPFTKKVTPVPKSSFHSWEQESEDIFTTLQKTTNIENLEKLIRRSTTAFLSTNPRGVVVNNNALHIFQGYYITVAHGMFETASIDHDNKLWPVTYVTNIADDVVLVKCDLVLEPTLHYFASHTRYFTYSPHNIYMQKCVRTVDHMHSIKYGDTVSSGLVTNSESWASYNGSRTIVTEDKLTSPVKAYVGVFSSEHGTCGSAGVRLGRGGKFGHIDSILVAGSDNMTILMPIDVQTLVRGIASDGQVTPRACFDKPMWEMECCNTTMMALSDKATISYHKPPPGTTIWGTLHRNGRPVHSHKSNKAKVFESIFHPYLRSVSPIVDTYTLPTLRRVVDSDGNTISSPWDFNTELLFSPKDTFPLEDFEDASKEFLAGFSDVDFRGPLTIDEALHGACGEKRMNFATSYGFPFNTPKKNVFTCIDPHNNLYKLDPVGKSVHDAMLEVYKLGGRVYPPFTSSLKASEVVSVKKNAIGKIRMFQGPPAPFIVIVRQYFLPVLSFLKNHPMAENAIGINTFGPEWAKLYERLNSFGKGRVIAGDYAAFDKTISELAIRTAFKILIALAQKTGNYTPEDITIMESIAVDSALPTMILKGDVFTIPGSLSSGHPLTTLINCIVGSLYLRIAFKHRAVYGASRLPVQLSKFRTYVKPTTFGDDNTLAVSPDIDFSHTMIQDYFKDYNITYTMAEKDRETQPYITAEESTFLSRGFLVRGPYVLDPLSLKSIVKCLAFRKESIIDESERLLDILQDQHRELLRQPEEVRVVYLRWFDDLLEIYNRHYGTRFRFLPGGYPQDETIRQVMEGESVNAEVLVHFRSQL